MNLEGIMASWKRAIHNLEVRVDRFRNALKNRYSDDPLTVQPYISYGTEERFYVRGRVLEEKALAKADADDSAWENFGSAWKRFRSEEVPNARLKIRYGNLTQETKTDDEGFFSLWIDAPTPLPPSEEGFYHVDAHLLEPLRGTNPPELARVPVAVPKEDAQFGIISDMDDTVLQTGATNAVGMARKVLFGNAKTRVPFEGVSAFYDALQHEQNPIFYVSSSPWNLYDLLLEFLETNDIPVGPIMLRDWGVSPTELLPTSHGDHKREAIDQILETYPDLPFILIGDSGQEDPEIYRGVVHDYPGRILAVYIRSVHEEEARSEKIQALAEEVEKAGSHLILAQDTLEAAEHAAAQGWISMESIAEVGRKKTQDEQEASF